MKTSIISYCLLLFVITRAGATQELCRMSDKGGTCACLEKTLAAANSDYLKGQDSGLSDSEYDGLKAYMQSQACDDGAFLQNRPASEQTVPLFSPMGSLHKVYSPEAAIRFLKNKSKHYWLIQPKLDGVAIELIYKHGLLKQAATRGDGLTGQNVIAALRRVTSLPHKLPSQKLQVIRGELIADKACYVEFDNDYSSQRQFVAAMLNSRILEHDVKQAKKLSCLQFYPYYWLNSELHSALQTLQELHRWGFADMQRLSLPVIASNLQQRAHQLDGLHQLPVDGYVLKLDDRRVRAQNSDSRYRPKWALAWKKTSPAVITQVKSIDWRLGRTGRLTPVLHIKAIKINGLNITQLSGYSYAWLKKNNISQSAIISVKLKGEAIAQLGELIARGQDNLSIPREVLKASEPDLCLEANELCTERFWLQFRFSLKKLGVRSVSDKQLRIWMHNLPLHLWQQIFLLTDEQWQPLLGVQTLIIKQRLTAMLKNDDALAILTLLGPKGFGKVKIKAVAERFPEFSELSQATVQQLIMVPGIGAKQAKDLVALLDTLDINKG